MTLDWKPQLTTMTDKLTSKLQNLAPSFATPRQAMGIIQTAIISSIAYAFLVTPCSENDLAHWDRLALSTVKERYKLWQCTATAILREDKLKFELGCPSIAVECNTRCAVALNTSLNNTGRHGCTTKSLLESQIQNLRSYLLRSINPSRHTPTFISKHTAYMLRVRQYLCINNSALDITFQGATYLLSSILPVLNALPMPVQPTLMDLGITSLSSLLNESLTHVIDGNKCTSLLGRKV
eukprot:1145091-Pelagomonas_calceolata.AAC.2